MEMMYSGKSENLQERESNTMKLEDKIKQLEQEFEAKIKSLKEEAQLEQEGSFPKHGDMYWVIYNEGHVSNGIIYTEEQVDLNHKEIGNFFKTKEDAEDAVEKFRTEETLRQFGRPFKNGENNYHIVLIDGEAVQPDMWTIVQNQGTIYFESEEKAQQAIDSIGEERIKKYIFGVEE